MKTGKWYVEADTLSRIPWDNAEDYKNLDSVAVKAILSGCSQQSALFEAYAGYLSACKESLFQSVDHGYVILSKKAEVTTPGKMTNKQWSQEQDQDPVTHQALQLYKSGK